jgi:putative tryptophan/tyrosine transport system substrate-binding protein
MRRLLSLAAAAIVALAIQIAGVQAQPKVGLLIFGDATESGGAFRDGLRALGWIEGANVALVIRHAGGSLERLQAHAAELVDMKVDVIAAIGTSAVSVARQETSTIPIVMTGIGADPIGAGLIASFGRPGGNITGTALMFEELAVKQLEILLEALPHIRTVAVLLTNLPVHERRLARLEPEAARLGLKLIPLVVGAQAELPRLFDTMTAAGADAVFVFASPIIDDMRADIAGLALRHRLPSAAQHHVYARSGVLVCYAPSLAAAHRRAAFHVDKLLRGAEAADLPVEGPDRFELTVNLKTARALGLVVAPALLARADEVIE